MVAVISFGIITNAQDVITLKNGTDINALVQKIGDIEIEYKKFDNPNGPNYILKKSEILMIRYENGSKDIFLDDSKSVESKDYVFNENKPTSQVYQCNISVCGLLVACEDYPELLTYYEALNAPTGYRLPSLEELECMAKNKSTLKLITNWQGYWSSEDAIRNRAYYITMDDEKKEKCDRSDKRYVRYIISSTTSNSQTTCQQQSQEYQKNQSTGIIKDEVNSNIMYVDNICILNTNCGFKIMCYDLPDKMTWEEAQRACPKGYHLPDYNEMKCMCMEHSPNYEINEKSYSTSVATRVPLYPYRQYPYNPTLGVGSTTNTTHIHKNQYELALHITERIYWTRSVTNHNSPIAITTNDAHREPKESYRKFHVRCVKDL